MKTTSALLVAVLRNTEGVECLCAQPEELAYITTNIAGLTTDRVRWLVATLTQTVDAAASVVDHDVFRAVRDQTIREWVESTGFVFDDVQVSDAEPLLSLAHCLTVVVLSQLQGRLGTTTVASGLPPQRQVSDATPRHSWATFVVSKLSAFAPLCAYLDCRVRYPVARQRSSSP